MDAYSLNDIYEIRGVNNPCHSCRGFGVKIYSSGSTWRGGIGGAVMKKDVCNKCWGSGDEKHLWPSHKEIDTICKAVKNL